jgi:beta-glucosidase
MPVQIRHSPTFASIATVCCLGFLLSSCTSSIANEDSKSKPINRAVENYKTKHERFVKIARGGNIDLLFVGDSITEYWLNDGKSVWDAQFAKWNPGNFGISGDTTYGVLARLDEELVGIKPKVTVLLIGTNDLSHGETPENIAANTAKIVKVIKTRLPDTTVIVLGVFPRGQSGDAVQKPLAKLNQLNSKLENGRDVRYLDISKSFLDNNGAVPLKIMPDLLHLSPEGYRIWADAIKDYLVEILDDKK